MIVFLMYYVKGEASFVSADDRRRIKTTTREDVMRFRHPHQHIYFQVKRYL